jgi:cellulose synthase/poly-beta-1,6-N-acetylglucosamine synthase-like glycosyltransferase
MVVVVTAAWAWLAFVALVMFVYALRHLVLTGGRLLVRQRPSLDEIVDSDLRPLTVLVPMHNEGAVAAQILERLTESDYPKDRLEVMPIDDHSEDTTAGTLQRYAAEHPFVRPIHRRSGRRGKPAGLNDALALASHRHTLVFDADYEPSSDLIRGLAAAFHDPEVGAVMGRVVPRNTDVNLLTRLLDLERSGGYQVDQQQRESFRLVPQYGGTVGGFRSTVVRDWGGFDPRILAEDTDATFQLAVRGWRIAYSNRAECYEEVPHTWDGRFRQLRRWARGHTQVLVRRLLPVLGSRYLTLPQTTRCWSSGSTSSRRCSSPVSSRT